MSINIRRNLLVVAGTFLFKVINIEKKHSGFCTTLRIVTLHYGRVGRMYTETCESNRPSLSVLIVFFGGVGREECLDAPFSDECFNHLVHYVPLASTLKETDGWSKTWKTCETI